VSERLAAAATLLRTKGGKAVQILDAQTSTQLARERHERLASDYAASTARQAVRRRSIRRRRRLLAVLRPRAA
jgi:hypothetical protein